MRPIHATLALAAALSLAACDDGGGGPSSPEAAVCGDEPAHLAVGQAAWLAAGTGNDASCVLRGGSAYDLAYVDLRAVNAAETGPEPVEPLADYTVTVTTGDGAARGARASREGAGGGAMDAGGDEVVRHASAAQAAEGDTEPQNRATPWAVGERFPLWDPYAGAARPARVLRIYGGHIVVAWHEDDLPHLRDGYLAALDAAMPEVLEHTVPLLRATYVDRLPITSGGSGQLLFVLRNAGPGTASGWANSLVVGDSVRNWISLRLLDPGDNPYRMAQLVSHEMTHAYQRIHMAETRTAPGQVSTHGAGQWSVEGGASFVAWEAVRRMAGADLQGNLDWRTVPSDPALRAHVERAQPGRARFNDGYDNAMGFMRDLLVRRVRAGDTPDAAMREISRGVIEGWYGIDTRGTRRKGLTARMRERLGDGWTPGEALLTWTLSHSADDLTRSDVFQDRVSREVWNFSAPTPGWAADAALAPDDAATARRPYGAPGFMRLAARGELRLRATADVPGVRWMVLRVK